MHPNLTLTLNGILYTIDTTPADDGSNRCFAVVWHAGRVLTSTVSLYDDPLDAVADATLMLRDPELRVFIEEGY